MSNLFIEKVYVHNFEDKKQGDYARQTGKGKGSLRGSLKKRQGYSLRKRQG